MLLPPWLDALHQTRYLTVRDGVNQAFAALPTALRGTLTWDQGKEMAQHQQIASTTGMDVYFCDAHSPWQRGFE